MVENTNTKIEAQPSKKIKGAKATRTSNVSKISTTMNRARRKFQQQLKKMQTIQTKIDCIEEVAEEVYGSVPQMVWHDLLKEAKRLTNLVDFNEYCRSLDLNPSYVAQHIVFEGSGVVNKVMRNGVENVLGAMIIVYNEPLFNPVKLTNKDFSQIKMKQKSVTAGQLMDQFQPREEVAEVEALPDPTMEDSIDEEAAA